MDYIIETHIDNNNATNFQTRVFKTESFEKYIKRLKNNECFIVEDMFGSNSGCSIPKLCEIKILKEDLINGVFVFMSKWGLGDRTVYLKLTHKKHKNY